MLWKEKGRLLPPLSTLRGSYVGHSGTAWKSYHANHPDNQINCWNSQSIFEKQHISTACTLWWKVQCLLYKLCLSKEPLQFNQTLSCFPSSFASAHRSWRCQLTLVWSVSVLHRLAALIRGNKANFLLLTMTCAGTCPEVWLASVLCTDCVHHKAMLHAYMHIKCKKQGCRHIIPRDSCRPRVASTMANGYLAKQMVAKHNIELLHRSQ